MPKRARINGCSKLQLAILGAYLSLAAGGALLLSLTSLNDDIQGVAPKDMALLGAVIGAGASVVLDNLVRWRFDEQSTDAPNKYLLGGACVGLAALGAFGFPYVHGPADTVPGQFKAASGAFLACFIYVVVDQVVRRRYDIAADHKKAAETAALLAPARAETAAERRRAELAEAEVRRLQEVRLSESQQREAVLQDALLAAHDRAGKAHEQGVNQAASLFAGAFTAATQLFGMGARASAAASTPSEASRFLSLPDDRASRVAVAAAAPRRALLLDAPRQGSAPAAVVASQRSSQRSALLPQVATTGLGGRAPTATPPSSIADLIRG